MALPLFEMMASSSSSSPDFFFASPLKLGSALFSSRNATISKTVQSDSAKRVPSLQHFLLRIFFKTSFQLLFSLLI